jgi:outer membrane protein
MMSFITKWFRSCENERAARTTFYLRRVKKGLVPILICFALSAGAQKTLTLEQCVDVAWTNNLQIKQAELSLESSESSLDRAKSDRLPNLNGFASHNYNWGQRIDPFTNQFANTRVQSNSFGLSSSVNLFNGFQNNQNIKGQQAALEAVMFDLEAQKNDVALAVSSAFLAVLLADELRVVAEKQLLITRQQLSRISKLVEAGSINVGSKYDLEAQLAQDESNATQREIDFNLNLLQLKQLLLLPANEDLGLIKPSNLDSEPDAKLESTATVYSFAETNMPEIKRAEKSLLQWESQFKSAQGARYPSLSLSGSIGSGYSGLRTTPTNVTQIGTQAIGATESGEAVYVPTYDSDLQKVDFGTQVNDNFNQFIGLSLNVPIFNRGAVSNSMQQARINQDIAQLQLQGEKQVLLQKIENARAQALAARQLYKANEKLLASSEKAFEFATARFEAGALNTTEFNTSKNNVVMAASRTTRSKYDFVFKTKVLEFYMGKPLSFEE